MIKKLVISFSIFSLALIAQVLFVPSSFAQASESISDYKTEITINSDSSIFVVETISYDFGIEQRHGILRDIPYKYKARGGTFKLRVSDFSVTNDKLDPIPFTQSTSGGEVHLKIGDADKTVTGKQIYIISYSVGRAINYFDDHDELYWNAIGNTWEIPILKSSTVVTAQNNITQVMCFTGEKNSTEQDCSITGGNTPVVTFVSNVELGNNKGLTIVAGLPAGTLAKPTLAEKLWNIFLDNGILILPIFVFALMMWLWNKYGKDAKRKNSVVAQYDSPNGMSALYMGTLAHSKTDNKDIAAEIVYLASRGFLTINRSETKTLLVFKGTDYEFTKLDKSQTTLAPQSKALLNALFDGGATAVKLSDLKSDTTFGQALVKIKSSTLSELVKEKYAHPSWTERS